MVPEAVVVSCSQVQGAQGDEPGELSEDPVSF